MVLLLFGGSIGVFGVFVSGVPDIPITWQDFMLPITLISLGTIMTLVAFKMESKSNHVPSLNSDSHVQIS